MSRVPQPVSHRLEFADRLWVLPELCGLRLCSLPFLQTVESEGRHYDCDFLPFMEIGSVAHKYYLINIRLPVNDRKGINVGIGEIKDIRLVVSALSLLCHLGSAAAPGSSSSASLGTVFLPACPSEEPSRAGLFPSLQAPCVLCFPPWSAWWDIFLWIGTGGFRGGLVCPGVVCGHVWEG